MDAPFLWILDKFRALAVFRDGKLLGNLTPQEYIFGRSG
jgi:hypothetical protein